MQQRVHGSLLLHPVHLVAMLLLGANDHWFKTAWPGPITGKVSDVAGLVVLPIVLISGAELIRRRPISWLAAAAVSVACALGFAAVETWPAATNAYAVGLGWLQWLLSGADGTALSVRVTADPTDLLTLPAAVIPAVLTRRPDKKRAPTQRDVPSTRNPDTAASTKA
jgi:hypothetical protein